MVYVPTIMLFHQTGVEPEREIVGGPSKHAWRKASIRLRPAPKENRRSLLTVAEIPRVLFPCCLLGSLNGMSVLNSEIWCVG